MSQNRLTPSPRPEESHEEILESHNRLSPSQEARRKTQQSWRAGKDSCRVIGQKKAMRESWGATTGSVRVKKQGGRLSRAGEPGKTHAQSRAKGSHEGAITSHQRLSYQSRSTEKTQLSRKSREEAQVESWSRGEQERSLSESQATQ